MEKPSFGLHGLRSSIGRSLRGRLVVPDFFPSVQGQPRTHKALRLLWWEGIFETIGEGSFANYISLYLLDMGASVPQVGLLSSVANFSSLMAQIPGARASGVWARPKTIVMITSRGITRLIVLLFFLVPFLLHGASAVYAMIALVGLRSLAGAFGTPAYTALLADIIPMRIRGKYLSSRQFFLTLCSLVIVPVAGQIIQARGYPTGYQICFLIAIVAGLTAAYFYGRIPDPGSGAEGKAGREVFAWREIVREKPFLKYCLTSLIWTLGVQFAGPFFSPYMVNELGFGKGLIGWLTTVTSISSLVGMRFFGPRIDRHGARWVMIASGFIIPFFPLIWLVARGPWEIGVANLISGFAWAGYNLASLNFLLGLVPAESRERDVAVFNTVNALAAIIGPFVGGLLYASFGFRANLAVSSGGRLLGIILFTLLAR